jgi:hypothetical protein
MYGLMHVGLANVLSCDIIHNAQHPSVRQSLLDLAKNINFKKMAINMGCL